MFNIITPTDGLSITRMKGFSAITYLATVWSRGLVTTARNDEPEIELRPGGYRASEDAFVGGQRVPELVGALRGPPGRAA